MAGKTSTASGILETCPHCGHTLSPWEQVLLNVDRALMCRHCWYRIYLDSQEEELPTKKTDTSDSKE
jgi:hypothetical protein